ncbi:MAG: hypothetical protein ACI81V_001375, partial [Lentimonas sp.]
KETAFSDIRTPYKGHGSGWIDHMKNGRDAVGSRNFA